MAIKPETEFPGKIIAGNANYPQGSARNVTLSGDGTGTPWRARLVNDVWGFFQRLLSDAAITPSGNPDTVVASDYVNALNAVYPRKAQANTFTKTQTWKKGVDIPDAAALVLGDGNSFVALGATTITSIGTKGIGTVVIIRIAADRLITHNGVSLTLPGDASMTLKAGDILTFHEFALGNWELVNYAASVLPAGTIVPLERLTKAGGGAAFDASDVMQPGVIVPLASMTEHGSTLGSSNGIVTTTSPLEVGDILLINAHLNITGANEIIRHRINNIGTALGQLIPTPSVSQQSAIGANAETSISTAFFCTVAGTGSFQSTRTQGTGNVNVNDIVYIHLKA